MEVDDDCCGCGDVETEEHVVLKYKRCGEERGTWRGVIKLQAFGNYISIIY